MSGIKDLLEDKAMLQQRICELEVELERYKKRDLMFVHLITHNAEQEKALTSMVDDMTKLSSKLLEMVAGLCTPVANGQHN